MVKSDCRSLHNVSSGIDDGSGGSGLITGGAREDENAELRTQIQNLQQQLSPPQQQLHPPPQQLSPPQHTNLQIDTIRVPNQQISLATSPNTNYISNKRKCPKCGAMGFAIKEVNDKTRLISYVPSRIYAKKRVCTKCRYEF